MMRTILYLFIVSFLSFSCGKKEEKVIEPHYPPEVSNDGNSISFHDSETSSFFKTEQIGAGNIEGKMTVSAKVAATVLPSGQGAAQNVILFNNPDLSAHYTQLVQGQTNIRQLEQVSIKQKQLELKRTEDLLAHGAATGQDLINVQTELSMEQNALANERTALIEHESQLKSGGFDPKTLRTAKANTAYIISDIPENQIDQIRVGETCEVVFTAFPGEVIQGKIDAVADIVDAQTRMVKVRIVVENPSNRIKSGMYAQVSFDVDRGETISIPNAAVVTVQGKHYVFIKTGSSVFERRPVQIGQQMNDRILIVGGLEDKDEVVVEGVMQLKGLSFGY